MKLSAPRPTSGSLALLCIWTLDHQRRLTVVLALAAGGALALVGGLVLLDRLSPAAAGNAVGLGAAALGLLVWLLLQARKQALLVIRDPALRRVALQAMVRNICARSRTHCPLAPAGRRDGDAPPSGSGA